MKVVICDGCQAVCTDEHCSIDGTMSGQEVERDLCMVCLDKLMKARPNLFQDAADLKREVKASKKERRS